MPSILDPILRLHQHRTWSNRKLLDAAASLTDSDLHREFQIGQGSLWRTLTHLFAAEYVWLAALEGDRQPVAPGDVANMLPGNQQGADPLSSLPELRAAWDQLEARWERYLHGLTAKSLNELVYKQSTSSGFGQQFGTKRMDVLLHVCTHAHYTTAQAINILRHLGVKPLPDPMLITLSRHESGPAPLPS